VPGGDKQGTRGLAEVGESLGGWAGQDRPFQDPTSQVWHHDAVQWVATAQQVMVVGGHARAADTA
jgi:hypothetical protein